MPYIPVEWVRNKDNWKEIDLIMQYLDQDIITPEIAAEKARLIERLKEIGEVIIYSKVIEGLFTFGA
jgi:hypothetical protein